MFERSVDFLQSERECWQNPIPKSRGFLLLAWCLIHHTHFTCSIGFLDGKASRNSCADIRAGEYERTLSHSSLHLVNYNGIVPVKHELPE